MGGSREEFQWKANLPLYGTDNVGWLKDEGKGHAVAHEDASQQNITQLTSRGAYNGRLIVPDMEMERDSKCKHYYSYHTHTYTHIEYLNRQADQLNKLRQRGPAT